MFQYLRGNLGDCTFGFVYLMELSTPFVSARGILSRMRLKSSRLYIVNGILMLLTFFVCRVLSLPYVCLLYSRVIGLSYVDVSVLRLVIEFLLKIIRHFLIRNYNIIVVAYTIGKCEILN